MKRNLILFLAFDLVLVAGVVVLLLRENSGGNPPAAPADTVETAPQTAAIPQLPKAVEPVKPVPPSEIESLRVQEDDVEKRWLEARKDGKWSQATDLKRELDAVRSQRKVAELREVEQAQPAPDDKKAGDGLSPEWGGRVLRVPIPGPGSSPSGGLNMPFGYSTQGPWDTGGGYVDP